MADGSGSGHRRWWAGLLVAAVAGGALSLTGQAAAAPALEASDVQTSDVQATDEVTTMAGCDNHPWVPDWFYPALRKAARNNHDRVPDGWGYGDKGRAMMKIICNESSFKVTAYNGAGPYYGLGQLGRPAIDAANVRFRCYWYVNDGCRHERRYWQCLAALRYAKQRYGGPIRAWNHWKNQGWW